MIVPRICGRSFGAVALLLALITARALLTYGQMNTGEILGKVTDPSGATVPNAEIMARQIGTHSQHAAVTDASGQYLLSLLPVGTYTLTVSAPQFKQAKLPSIVVHAGDHLRQDFALEIGIRTQSVTVSGTPGLLQIETAAIKDTVTQQEVTNLPLKGRQFMDLVQLTPAVVHPPGGTRGGALQQAGRTVGILGQRAGHNLYLVDGVSVTDEYFNNLVLSPSVDNIQEFTLDKTSYDAEFGGKSGAVINVVTKSGSNDFHGSLFEFVRNSVFDAKNFFDAAARSIPPFRQNQFGGSFGGPIIRNKTFFFLSYEGERIAKSETQIFTVPTTAERSGNFQGVAAVYDPSTTNSTTGARLPFPNDMIPNIDPVAEALLGRVPLPNLPGNTNNLLATELSTKDLNQYTARFDQHFGPNDHLFGRATVYDVRESDPFGSSALHQSLLPGFGQYLRTHTDSVVGGWTHVFSPNWYNAVRFGWLRVSGGQSSPNAGTDFAGPTGLQGVTSHPLDTGYPQASLAGFSTIGDPTSLVSRIDSDEELYDDVIWHQGTHNVKFGAYFFHMNFNPLNPNMARGLFQFTRSWTMSSADSANATGGSALADFLLGYPTLAQVGLGRGGLHARTNWFQLYVQDGWQILPSLKLDVGVRYEYNQNLADSNNEMSVVNTLVPGGQFVIASDDEGGISSAATPLLSEIPIPYVTSSEIGWDRSLLVSRPLRFAPRLGIAWALPDGTSVLRTAFGIYTNQAAYSVNSNTALNLPFFFAKTVDQIATSGIPELKTENILTAPNAGSISANNVSHDYKIEYNEVWNLAIERSLSSSTAFEVQYVGSRTVHADDATLQNLFPVGGSLDPSITRPIPQMSGFVGIRWNGWASYQALTLQLVQRAWQGLSLNANYTWSKSLDDASNPGPTDSETNLPQDPGDLTAEKGWSSFDVRNRFVVSFLYEIPSFKGSNAWKQAVLAGWQVGGIWTAQGGSPFTVNLSYDNAHNGTPVMTQRPDVICNPNNGPKTPAEWFDTSCFQAPASNAYGTAGRNVMFGPGLNNFDATVQKNISPREGVNLQLRVDAFNLFNHPNFANPNHVFTAAASGFGSITTAKDPRQLQLSMRLTF